MNPFEEIEKAEQDFNEAVLKPCIEKLVFELKKQIAQEFEKIIMDACVSDVPIMILKESDNESK